MGEAARRFAQSRVWQGSLERVYTLYRSASQAEAVGASPERGPTARAGVSPMRAGDDARHHRHRLRYAIRS
jgi:hypothetical protein